LVLDKGALALAIGMGGLILLLLIGTQVLDWYWPVLLTAVSLGVGLYQLRKHIPSLYQLAQRIDHRMALADSLSTAVYFAEHPKPGLERVCAMQSMAAERLASGVNLEQALPLARPRYLYPALALFAVASGLFVARYVVLGSLDLNASLLQAAFDEFLSTAPEDTPEQMAKLKLKGQAFDPSQPEAPGETDPTIVLPPDAEKGTPLTEQEGSGQQNGKDGPKADQEKDGEEQGNDSKDSSGQQGKDGKQQQGDEKGDQGSQGDDERSMLDKLRDAVSNLMNKVNPQDGKQQKGKAGDKQKGQKQDKGSKGDDQNADGSETDEAPPDQSSKSDKGKQGDDSKPASTPGQNPSGEPASGMGQNEGKKDIEAAKAEEAMGKVSEMLAKRGDEIKGQVMVEVKSTKQTLKTAMTQSNAGHSDAGGEIHRDQVPLADQLFVERYFQEVRKASSTGQTKGK
jgi:hypothetical protein